MDLAGQDSEELEQLNGNLNECEELLTQEIEVNEESFIYQYFADFMAYVLTKVFDDCKECAKKQIK